MPNVHNLPDENELHMIIVMKIWNDIAAYIYQAYLEQGRGVVAMFMMDTLPDDLKAMLPKMPEKDGVIQGGILSAYIPLDSLDMLEDLVGLEGVLKIDEQVHRYDPAASIVFAFLNKRVSSDGTPGVSCVGYEMTPPSRVSPLEMYKKRNPISVRRIYPPEDGHNPLTNLN